MVVQEKVAKIVPYGLSQLHIPHLATITPKLCDSERLADLGRFSQLLEETEHFLGRGQEKVAKIVHCGEPKISEAAGLVPAAFSLCDTHFLHYLPPMNISFGIKSTCPDASLKVTPASDHSTVDFFKWVSRPSKPGWNENSMKCPYVGISLSRPTYMR